MTIPEQVKYHQKHKHLVRIDRSKDQFNAYSKGYIVGSSDDFLLIQEVDNFSLWRFQIIPVNTIAKVRYGNDEKYQDKIMLWEKQKELIGIQHEVDLSDWMSIFRSIKQTGHNVIVKGEALDGGYFTIGPIRRIGQTAVNIQYFSTDGFLQEKLDKISYTDITIVNFNDRYIDIFSKYLR